MEKCVVRLVELEICNIKNVIHGRLDFSRGKKGSILGIYGQNGSGKTVVVDCMVLLKCLLSGRQIPFRFGYFINMLSENASVKYCFQMEIEAGVYYAEYEVTILKKENHSFCISGEKLSMRKEEEGTRLTPVFEYKKGEKELFRPKKYYNYFEKSMDHMIALGVAKQATEGYDEEAKQPEVSSFLFSAKAQEVFSKADGDARNIYLFSRLLNHYGIYDLAVIENAHYGLLTLNMDTLPINIDWPDRLKARAAGIMLKLTDVNVIPQELYACVENTVAQINLVMKALIPDLKIELYNTFDKLMQDGRDGVRFEIITVRDGVKVPLPYESAGIKKMISICSNLVACYNRESYCLVVDELDSGIYEYLLGECLEVMQDKAKGQLIFTSHNLRPLEVLRNEFLIYTTVNPQNRYIKSSYIKNTQNTRLSYLRSIKLGGQKEQLYNDTNMYEIELAMRRAGKVARND